MEISTQVFVIDFDSTLVKVESLDMLADIVLETHPEKEKVGQQIREITQLGMEGKIGFGESLERRVKLFSPMKRDIEKLVSVLRENISDSVLQNLDFFRKYADSIYIISGGFYEFIVPIAKDLGILDTHILANRFVWEGEVAKGFDRENPLSKKGGKIVAVRDLKLEGEVIVIGDGYTDYEIRKEGEADLFIAYCENVRRESVTVHADVIAENFDQVIGEIGHVSGK